MSPRLSSLYAISEVLIEGSNDPYGVLSLTPDLVLAPETDTGSCKYINLVIQRTGMQSSGHFVGLQVLSTVKVLKEKGDL